MRATVGNAVLLPTLQLTTAPLRLDTSTLPDLDWLLHSIKELQKLQELPDKGHTASTLSRMSKSIHAPQPKGLKK